MLSAPLRVFLFVLAECVLEITDFGGGEMRDGDVLLFVGRVLECGWDGCRG
ncbi:hypothetical protein KC19_VG336300 [Ceratodon purpureus]|uniref:Uncharacterized protein n=1 Tax=Ceratodon purpureus TaxID=3225 RepID=A0A8T0HX16_CERPU|nr:hypothetical protein KC19_VG336300 [Ceratodon purpureus]